MSLSRARHQSYGRPIVVDCTPPIADHRVPAVARIAGLFRKWGIDVKVRSLQRSQLLPAPVTGSTRPVFRSAPGDEIASADGPLTKAGAQMVGRVLLGPRTR